MSVFGEADGVSTVDDVRLPWWQPALLGAVSVGFGVAVLAWPDATLRAIVIWTGIWLILLGAARLFAAVVGPGGWGIRLLTAGAALLLIGGGIACLVDAVAGLTVLAVLVAVAWIVSGVCEVVLAFGADSGARPWLLGLGVLSTVVGVAFLVLPRLSLASLVLFTAASALVVGVGSLVVAVRLRRA
ncbi:hypothetical protein Val02_47680 [Virgisporangium aliadipatigenens]|uniref:HdeD family acid-resistance protein n=1 Tax=Virgisporangium aliadipatigenens TaxID=741659 RepID=A0A8J3YNW6_9ACTN|nr:DUF308 domain-containing protein [Virgisporangium aliadipatigenens]GIJ47882.1 hypothetical protein Val02_47680 [Virgisporangium aliadipatigenens]